jgi:signal peptidase I
VITRILASLAALWLIAFGIAYVAGYRVYKIPTNSMQPTVEMNEWVVGRLSESYRERVRRFDIAIYRTPQAPGQIYAKRIVGLSGEKISIDANGVMIDGKNLPLPATVSTGGFRLKGCNLVVPKDAVFLLGDFTENSADSRYLGPVAKQDLIGYLVFKK